MLTFFQELASEHYGDVRPSWMPFLTEEKVLPAGVDEAGTACGHGAGEGRTL